MNADATSPGMEWGDPGADWDSPGADWDMIYVYTRAQALEDGVLVDVSEMAREAGFRLPVAVTAAIWALIEAIPERYQGLHSADGRLWDVLWMACYAIRGAVSPGTELRYSLTLHTAQSSRLKLKLVTGPGDQGEPVVTIMLPEED